MRYIHVYKPIISCTIAHHTIQQMGKMGKLFSKLQRKHRPSTSEEDDGKPSTDRQQSKPSTDRQPGGETGSDSDDGVAWGATLLRGGNMQKGSLMRAIL